MYSRLLADVTALGELVRVSDLHRRGYSPATMRRAVESGVLFRVVRGWVASTNADQTAVAAVAHGGKLTSAAALASRGTWDGVDRRLHVQLPPNRQIRTPNLITPIDHFVAPRFARRDFVRHWAEEKEHDEYEPAWRVSVTDALVRLGRSAPADQFVACVDSALHLSTLARTSLPTLSALLPSHVRPLLEHCDPKAGSGLESLTRFRLAPLVNTILTQAPIVGIAPSGGTGFVDLLVDGWLVIELDGDEWHEPRTDKARDSLLVRQGLRSQRFNYDQVIHRWEGTEATVMELLRYPPRGIRRA